MGKIHLRETAAFFDASKYTQVANESVSGKLNEQTKRALDKEPKKVWSKSSLASLEETFDKAEINPEIVSKVLQNLKDGVTPQHKYWRLPVSRFDVENLNGRIYPQKLWENVQSQKDWVGITGLMDHPEDDNPGSTKDSAIVWLGLEIDKLDKIVYGIGAFVGFWGSLCEAILEVGGRLGFSSSGFGDMMSDGKTVDPDSYVLERLADVVFNPSQSVYGDMSDSYGNDKNIEYTEKQGMTESAKSRIIQAKEEINMNTQNKEPKVMSKTEEKLFRKYVEQFMADANNISNPSARLKEIADINNMFESGIAPDLKEKVEAKLLEERDNLEKLIAEATTVKEKLGVASLEKVAEGTKVLAAKAITLEEQTADYAKLVDELTVVNQNLKKENARLSAKVGIRTSAATKNSQVVNSKIVSLSEQKDTLASQLDVADKKISAFKEQIRGLNRSNEKLEADNSQLKRAVSRAKESASVEQEKTRKLEHRILQMKIRNNKLSESIKATQKSVKYLTEQNSKMLIEKGKMNKHILEQDETIKMLSNPQYAQYQEKQDYVDEMTGYVNFRESGGLEVEQYWNDIYKRYGENVKPFETKIRGAKTLAEATSNFLKYRDNIDEGFKSAHDARLDAGTLTQEDRRNILKEAGMDVDQPITEQDINDTTKFIRNKFGLN